MNDLAATLRLVRERRGLSPAYIADLVARNQRSVERWERGEATPPARLVHKLAVELDAPELHEVMDRLQRDAADLNERSGAPDTVAPEALAEVADVVARVGGADDAAA